MEKYTKYLKDADSIDFDLFKFRTKVGHKKVLQIIAFDSFTRCGVLNLLDVGRTEKFLKEVSNTYQEYVPYHNDLHGADVLQMASVFVQECELE